VQFSQNERERDYDIFIRNGLLRDIGKFAEDFPRFEKVKTFAIVTDSNVAPLYESVVAEGLSSAGFSVISYTIPAGEGSKCFSQYAGLCRWLAENQITRSDALVALGGGVVGDLTGFTAATYLRGVQFLQVPTTLLAMVDSSVGGKTGIDIPEGKNLVGAFCQPSVVLCDPLTLASLPDEELSDGAAEAIKHGMIRSGGLIASLEENKFVEKCDDFISCENEFKEDIAWIIAENVEIKRDIVEMDEFDTGERQLLNFGHTIGHAVERLSDFAISHGCGVAIGMAIMTRAAVKRGVCPQDCAEILENLLAKYNLPAHCEFSAQEIFHAALTDKKRTGDTITEVIPRDVGRCVLEKMPVSELLEWIEAGIVKGGIL